jgi:hypothetical protein
LALFERSEFWADDEAEVEIDGKFSILGILKYVVKGC